MGVIARTVHLTHPETGELVTLLKGTEIPEDEMEEFQEQFNNPTIFEDPDAKVPGGLEQKDIDQLTEEEFFFAADANGTVDEETFEPKSAEEVGGVSFDVNNYRTWEMGDLRDEVNRRKDQGRDISVDGRSREAFAAALEADDSAGVS